MKSQKIDLYDVFTTDELEAGNMFKMFDFLTETKIVDVPFTRTHSQFAIEN